MQILNTTFTVAEYCAQMEKREIIVNTDYQRSSKVWPPAAQSYLIDTILAGYPIPKLSLAQKTDLKTRKTTKEIVDGQQRSQAIHRFFRGTIRITRKGPFVGKSYENLNEDEQQKFVDYQINTDVFVGAMESEIREVFRRINSYNVPLNAQEHRHSTFQGQVKWFVVSLAEKYAQTMKNIGVLSEPQLSRMADGQLFSEIIYAMLFGITTSSASKLNEMYRTRDGAFPEEQMQDIRFRETFDRILDWGPIHRTDLMKPYNFYALALAITHCLAPIEALNNDFPLDKPLAMDRDIILTNLSMLADMVDQPERYPNLNEFLNAGRAATNTVTNRRARFRAFCRALQPQLIYYGS